MASSWVVSIIERSFSTARASRPEMLVVLKAVRGFPKNCWDSNINSDKLKERWGRKTFHPSLLWEFVFQIFLEFIQTCQSYYSTVEDTLPKYYSPSFPQIINISATFYKMSEEQAHFSSMLWGKLAVATADNYQFCLLLYRRLPLPKQPASWPLQMCKAH